VFHEQYILIFKLLQNQSFHSISSTSFTESKNQWASASPMKTSK